MAPPRLHFLGFARIQHAWETAFAAIGEHMRAGARLAEQARAESLPRSRILSSA